MNTCSKSTMWWILAVIILIGIGACVYIQWIHPKKVTTGVEVLEVKPIPTTTTSSNSTASPAWNVYTNDQYNFQITLPTTWEGYKYAINGNAINFYLPTTDTTINDTTFPGYINVFTITSYTPAQWDALEPNTPIQAQLIDQTDDYYYTFSQLVAAPNDQNVINLMSSDNINSIKSSFATF